MWQSKVWIDGRLVGNPVAYLSSPHQYNLGSLSKGKHRLVVQVDNSEIYPIGVLGHSYCPHMQTQWNGIVGKIKLMKVGSVNIKHVDVFPSFTEKKVRLQIEVENRQEKDALVNFSYSIQDKQTNKIIYKAKKRKNLVSTQWRSFCRKCGNY